MILPTNLQVHPLQSVKICELFAHQNLVDHDQKRKSDSQWSFDFRNLNEICANIFTALETFALLESCNIFFRLHLRFGLTKNNVIFLHYSVSVKNLQKPWLPIFLFQELRQPPFSAGRAMQISARHTVKIIFFPKIFVK